MLSSRIEPGSWSRNSSPRPAGTRYLRSTRVVAGAVASTSARVMWGRVARPGRSGTRRHPVPHVRLDVGGGVAQAGQAGPSLLDLVSYGDNGGVPDEVDLLDHDGDRLVSQSPGDLGSHLLGPDQGLVERQPQHPGRHPGLGVVD